MSSSRNKIAVLGARGQLGSELTSLFASPAYELACADLPELDITDSQACTTFLDSTKPGTVVNCAAYTRVDDCESNRELAMRVNAQAPTTIAEWCAAHNAYLVHISTDYVFNGTKPLYQPYTESDLPDPLSVYGESKLQGETGVLSRTAACAILRTAWLYSSNGANFLKTILRRAIADPSKPLRIVDDQHGSPTWAHRLAIQIRDVIAARPTGILHASAEGHTTWYELARFFLENMGIPHPIEPCKTHEYVCPARRPTNSIMENSRLKQLNIHQMAPWQDDLLEFVNNNRAALLRNAQPCNS